MLVGAGKIGRPGAAAAKAGLSPFGADIFPVPTTWTITAGTGATFSTQDSPRLISITTAGAIGSIRTQVPAISVVSGSWYRATYTIGLGSMFFLVGTSNGGGQYKSAAASQAAGATYTFDFLTTSTTLWLQFQRTATAGTSQVTNMTLFRLI